MIFHVPEIENLLDPSGGSWSFRRWALISQARLATEISVPLQVKELEQSSWT